MPAQYTVISETEDKTFVLPKCKYTVSVKQFHIFSGKFSAGPKLITAGQPLLCVGEQLLFFYYTSLLLQELFLLIGASVK